MRMLLICLSLASTTVLAAEWSPQTGPLIEGRGPWSPVELTWSPPADTRYRVVFDVAPADEDPSATSRHIESVARFLNMHVGSGVDPERIEVALVLHGGAARYALDDAAYEARFGVPNPEADLIQRLAEAGVMIAVCGQTAAYYGYPTDELAEGVDMALSAMTVVTTLQNQGWAIIAY